ncbi:MAG: hypothetical protein V4510_03865 [bacterium]
MAEGIVEGATRIFPPATNLSKPARSPGARVKGQAFYNPGMALNRDLSVLLVQAFAAARGREVDVGDALAGTGARAVRLAHEVDAPIVVHANDGQPEAVAAMRLAGAANGVAAGRLHVCEGDAHSFLASRRFDVVDLDPCGSPMPFVDAAMRSTRHGGLVCATATDTGALAGAFARACQRRYDAHHGLNAAPWRAEIGLRILGGALVRSAARHDRVATPVLSVCHGHWMRVVVRVEDGKRDADAAVRLLRNVVRDDDGRGRFVAVGEAVGPWAGPMWSGPLHSAELLAGMRAASAGKSLARPAEVMPLLDILEQEADAAPFWIVGHDWEKEMGPPPRRDRLITALRGAGIAACRTHMDPQGVRTAATMAELKQLWRV